MKQIGNPRHCYWAPAWAALLAASRTVGFLLRNPSPFSSATNFRLDDGRPQGRPSGPSQPHGPAGAWPWSCWKNSFPPAYSDEGRHPKAVASSADIANDITWIGHNVALGRESKSDLIGLLASRPVLEGHVRRSCAATTAETCGQSRIWRGAGSRDQCSRGSHHRRPSFRIDGEKRTNDQCRSRCSMASGPRLGEPGMARGAGLSSVRIDDKVEIGIGYMTRDLPAASRANSVASSVLSFAGSAPETGRNGVIIALNDDTLDCQCRRVPWR